MAMSTKIATCCYCGSRAALTLRQDVHELACASCGAPLHELKRLKRSSKPSRPTETRLAGQAQHRKKPVKTSKKKKRRKGRWAEFLDEAFDVIEDVFD